MVLHRRLRALALVLLLLLAPVGALAATYYVGVTGNDGNSCAAAQNPTTSKRTLTNGATCLGSGDTLILGNGTYVETLAAGTIPSGTPTAYTTIRAQNQRQAIIRGNPAGTSPSSSAQIMVDGRQYLRFDGLVFDGAIMTGGSTASFGRGLLGLRQTHNTVVENSTFRNILWTQTHDAHAIATGGGYPNYSSNITIRNSIFHDIHQACRPNCIGYDTNYADGDQSAGYPIYVIGANHIIEGNQFYDYGSWGIHAHDNSDPGVPNLIVRNNVMRNGGWTNLAAGRGSNQQWYNNIITGGLGPGIQVNTGYASSTNLQIFNNTIVGNAGACITQVGSVTSSQFRNNICYQNGSNGAPGGGFTNSNNLLGTDPLFTNAGAGDFTLREGSPAINTGLCLATVPSDHAGMPRPQPVGGQCDIGAHEWVSSADPPPLPAQMLAHWRLDEGTGTTAADATGSGHTGTLVGGPAWVPGRYGRGALLFDGSTQYVMIAGSDLQLGTFSLTAWAKPATCPHHTYQDILTRGGADPNFSMFLQLTPPCELIAGYWNGASYAQYLSPAPVRVGVWSHLAATYDGTTIRLFINGTEVRSGAGVGTPVVLTAPTSIGRAGGSNQWYFAGALDDPRLYNFALDAVAVKYLYATTAGKPRRRAVVQ